MRKHRVPLNWRKPDVRRRRFPLPNSVWEYKLRPIPFVILSCLCSCYARGQDSALMPETIARRIHLALSTVEKYLPALKAKRLVTDELALNPRFLEAGSKKYFTLPNEIFLLKLSPSAFMVYAYLLYNEDRRTHQCYPSYNSIAARTGLAKNTVMKCVGELLDRGFISVESSSYYDSRGMKWKGNNCYTILPTRAVLAALYQEQLNHLELDAEREHTHGRQAEHNRRHPREPSCAPGTAKPGPYPSGKPAAQSALRGV